MATDLSRRQAADERAADDTAMRAGSTSADVTSADRERDEVADPTVRLARVPSQPVPPGRNRLEGEAERDRAEADLVDADRADVTDADSVEPARPTGWAHTSFTATLSLIVGVCATLGALSGRLAPLAVVAGAIGLVLAAIGLAAVSRRHVTGHHVALLGLAFSIAGVVLGILAMTKSVPWLDSGADNVARLRGWLDAHWSWLRRW